MHTDSYILVQWHANHIKIRDSEVRVNRSVSVNPTVLPSCCNSGLLWVRILHQWIREGRHYFLCHNNETLRRQAENNHRDLCERSQGSKVWSFFTSRCPHCRPWSLRAQIARMVWIHQVRGLFGKGKASLDMWPLHFELQGAQTGTLKFCAPALVLNGRFVNGPLVDHVIGK